MDGKLLTKAAWEVQAKKLKVDARELSVALAAYEKCDTDDPEAGEESLKNIQKKASALKRDKDYKAASDYLGDVSDAAADALKQLAKKEAAGASGGSGGDKEQDEDEDEEEEDAGDLGAKLKSALNTVKSRGLGEQEAGTPHLKFVACVAGSGCGLVITRTPGKNSRKLAESVAGSSGRFIKGECVYENHAYTFIMERVSPGLAKKFSNALIAATGQKYKVRVRSLDGSLELDEETDLEHGEAPEGGAAQDGAPQGGAAQGGAAQGGAAQGGAAQGGAPQEASTEPPPATDEAGILAALKALKPQVDKLTAAAAPSASTITGLFVAAVTLLKNKEVQAASAKLEELTAALRSALAGLEANGQPPPAEQGGPAAGTEADFKARLTGLMPRIKEAIAAGGENGQAVKAGAGQAAASAKGGDFPGACAALDEVEKLLGAGSQDAISTEDFAKGRQAWDNLRRNIRGQLQQIEQAVIGSVRGLNGDEAAGSHFDEEEVALKVKDIYKILDGLDERLTGKLDEGLNAGSAEEQSARRREAGALIKEYQAFVSGNPLVAMIDSNGFAATSIESTASGVLADLAARFQPH
jgi:hypothetical protein